MSTIPVVAVVGATASGKSALALDLAERIGGEVVNTDAMALYRGMDIGTAKPSVADRRGIPHHLFDRLEVTEPASVAEFQGWARAVIEDCRAREVVPVLVGGSALYTRAVLDEFDFPGTDPAVRAKWDRRLVEVGAEQLHGELATRDPAAAAEILPSNGRRIVRALEVGEITGRPFVASLPAPEYHFSNTHQVGVSIDRGTLDRRIAARVDRMWAEGLVKEVRVLAERGLRGGLTASRALGYRQVLGYLDGAITEEQAREQTITGTRRFARRQESWYRNDGRITWVAHDDPDRVESAMQAITSESGS